MAKNTELTLPGAQRAAELMAEVKRQSQPRRFFWQEKTVRDLLNERRADLVDQAMERSTRLAATAAAQRDSVLAEVKRQSQPRRFFWQDPTAHDKVMAQRERIATSAIERANALADAAAERRDALLAEAQRQTQPSRWPWQQPTLRDKAEAQRAALVAQTQPSRWPWQQPTLRDKLEDRRNELQGTIADVLPTLQDKAAETSKQIQRGARSTATAVQQQVSAAPQRFSQVADDIAGSSQELASRIADRANETASSVRAAAEDTASSVRAAAMVPVDAVRGGVEAGQQAVANTVEASKRGVRRTVRLGRVFLWALLIGGIIGLLLAPRTGEETRRSLQKLWNSITELLPNSN